MEIIISFPGADVASANKHAQTLRDAIRTEAPEAVLEQRRNDLDHQDFGATLGIILAGPALIPIAKGIQQWLSRYYTASIEISTKDGKIIAKNITAKNAMSIVESVKMGDNRNDLYT